MNEKQRELCTLLHNATLGVKKAQIIEALAEASLKEYDEDSYFRDIVSDLFDKMNCTKYQRSTNGDTITVTLIFDK